MRILMVTSFPIPGEFDGTAMLPIKILRALKTRGVDVVLCSGTTLTALPRSVTIEEA